MDECGKEGDETKDACIGDIGGAVTNRDVVGTECNEDGIKFRLMMAAEGSGGQPCW